MWELFIIKGRSYLEDAYIRGRVDGGGGAVVAYFVQISVKQFQRGEVWDVE